MERLVFNYTAQLDDPAWVRFTGMVEFPDWQTEHCRTKSQRAWAFVRGLLDREGAWRCSVVVSGEQEERIVDVTVHEEGIVRLDRKEATP